MRLAGLMVMILGGCAVVEDGGGEAASQRVRAPDAGVGLVSLGPVDPAFGDHGLAALPRPGVEPRDLVVQPDGKILVAGSLFVDAESKFEGYLFRYLPGGALDPSFDGDGVRLVTADGLGPTTIALQPDGKIVLGGSCNCDLPARVWRLLPDGAPDPSFGKDGEVTLDALAAFIDHVAVEPDGGVRAIGMALADGIFVARLDADGLPEHTGVAVVPDFFVHASVPAPDGGWLLAGAIDPSPDRRAGAERTLALARLTPDGAWDEGYAATLEADYVESATLAGDRLLVGLGIYQGASRVEARRPDGAPDPGFGAGGVTSLGPAGEVFRILRRPDGALVVVTGEPHRIAVHARTASGAAAGPAWVSTLPPSVWIDHLQVGLTPSGDALYAAAIQHHRVVDPSGFPLWAVTGTALVRIPR